VTTISPLWVSLLAAQQLVLGDGTVQAFSARVWAVALLLALVYWIVRRRASRPLAIVAVFLTALLPVVSAAVRASSVEWVSGQASYYEHWYLDDLRPDFFTFALVMWAVAVLAEHIDTPRRSAYLLSAGFVAAAVLSKTSTAPVVLVTWATVLAINWLRNRRTRETARMSVVAGIFLALLLVPWAVFGGGVLTVVSYLKAVIAFRSNYSPPGGALVAITYFLVQIPNQLGLIEGWLVIVGGLVLVVALVRRRLGPAEIAYATVGVLLYTIFTLTPSKNLVLGAWISLSIWIFFWAGAAGVLTARWPERLARGSPVALAAVGAYTLVVYGLGLVALANWPANEQNSNAQLSAVTLDVAHELGRHVSNAQCFTYVPGPGWPDSILLLLMDAKGNVPGTTASDVDPTRTTVSDYVASAGQCEAVLAYREDIAVVAQEFFAPPVRQPYLRAVSNWVRGQDSGYVLDRTWRLNNLPPAAPHRLGHYQGVSLTLDLYLRT
jgi:hypothetical protein